MSLEDADAKRLGGLRAVAHPVRLRMLSLLTGAELSAAELARELGISQANASYHVRMLADTGEVIVVGTESVRGGVAKKYRYNYRDEVRSHRRPSAGDDDDQLLYAEAAYQELRRRLFQRKPRTRAMSSDAEVWLEPETWQRAMALVDEASRLVHEQARPPRTEGTVHVNFQTTLFQLSDDTEDTETPGGRQ
ncbi:winged helix-turn-helix transcriptional regulator [Flexivirga sp. ID2601S]|uniref:Winged helix-turn-helix transcriptional regulator n=1 Tax=Flexivirga aerilata TaxID=1656889 RepID=A0A849AHP5_9MICO|nr:winged helix-turn-helix domain-containing protein [Flexivirga aerilata]NNG38718.1 winged helix-turn-helix transcriptional regulator [Flexivirga aerilata]